MFKKRAGNLRDIFIQAINDVLNGIAAAQNSIFSFLNLSGLAQAVAALVALLQAMITGSTQFFYDFLSSLIDAFNNLSSSLSSG